MNKIPNRQAICEVLMDKAKDDKDIMVLCSDSRGSASMTPFADNFPDQFIETGIAEQKVSDIKEYHVDTFVMGDDWEGKFDFLKPYCDVVYLPRTPEISTTQIKADLQK